MKMYRPLNAVIGLGLGCFVSGALWAADGPATGSPGAVDAVLTVDQRCPTFVWGDMPDAKQYELAVYVADQTAGPAAEPVLAVELPGSVQVWIPPADRCLEAGSKYAWTVRAIGSNGPSAWAEPRVFEVVAPPLELEIRTALETLAEHPELLAARAKELGVVSAREQLAETPLEVSAPRAAGAGVPSAGSSIVVDGNYQYVNPKLGFFRIPGNSLVTMLDTLAYSLSRNIHGFSFVSSGPISPYAVGQTAPVHLPALATVTGLTCWYQDNSAAGGIGTTIELRRRAEDQGTSTSMASVTISTTGPDQSTDILSVSDNVIADALIFNALYDYYLYVPWSQSVAGSFLRFYGCEIEYEYSLVSH